MGLFLAHVKYIFKSRHTADILSWSPNIRATKSKQIQSKQKSGKDFHTPETFKATGMTERIQDVVVTDIRLGFFDLPLKIL